jgi:branched-chain amino acid transport system ATP-binding protein
LRRQVASGNVESTPLLRVRGLDVTFGGLTALNDVHLELHPGEVVGLIGPNGAGKTTLFNVVCGLVEPGRGAFELDGKERPWPRAHDLVDLGIARTLQGVGLFQDLTVLENVMIAAHPRARTGLVSALVGLADKDEKRLREIAMTALDYVGASHAADRYPSELPYPITKRVSLARAMALEPRILLLDEPAGGLGEEDLFWLTLFIREMSNRCAVLLVEHHMELVMAVSSKLYVLNFGEVIASGTPEVVRNDPAVIAAYLGASAVGGN